MVSGSRPFLFVNHLKRHLPKLDIRNTVGNCFGPTFRPAPLANNWSDRDDDLHSLDQANTKSREHFEPTDASDYSEHRARHLLLSIRPRSPDTRLG